MSSSQTSEETEMKAGHPPAVKAGGMRITQHRHNSTSDKKDEMTPEEREEFAPETPPTKGEKHHVEVLISGATGKGDSDFKPAAVKQFHEKPHSSKEMPHHKPQHNIQQPR